MVTAEARPRPRTVETTEDEAITGPKPRRIDTHKDEEIKETTLVEMLEDEEKEKEGTRMWLVFVGCSETPLGQHDVSLSWLRLEQAHSVARHWHLVATSWFLRLLSLYDEMH